ncbi:hypothetical protein DFQ26_009470 [Actinomortierella ambigua]|nr:hypothetical protein DFQ26_009470 [Actinomortierella ambigua]
MALSKETAAAIQEALVQIQKVVDCLSTTIKGASADVAVIAFQQDICYDFADLYRNAVKTVVDNVASVPEGSSDEIKRSMAGIQATLDIMATSSIASNNTDLLKVQPIFAADVLEQFRDAYVSLADKDDQKVFANTGLTLAIGASNALEACLRIAKDPEAAINDLNEDLDFDEVENKSSVVQNQAQGDSRDQQQQQQQQQPARV